MPSYRQAACSRRLKPWVLLTLGYSALAGGSMAWADTCTPYDATAPYQLVFADEFDGAEVDLSRWTPELLWGPGVIINNEMQYYVNDGQFNYNPFRINDGVLSIQADKAPFDRSRLYLTQSVYSATSAEVLWRQPEGAVSYDVSRDGALLGSVTGGAWFEPALRDGIDYAYEITARDNNGNALSTEQITVNTSTYREPSKRLPFSLELDRKIYSQTSAEIVWRSPNRVAYFDIQSGESTQRLVGRTFDSLYLGAIQSNTDIEYTVSAYDLCDELIVEDSIIVNTADGLTPNEVSDRLVIAASIYSTQTAEISWNAVAGATEYDVFDNGVPLGTQTGRSLFIDDMQPGIDRKFLVVALDGERIELDRTTRTLNTADASFALNRQPFVSGVLTSYDSFRFKYGKVEMRAKMPKGKGLWSAFWLLNAYYHDAEPEDPEIDIIEAIGDQSTTANHAYHTKRDTDGDGVTDTTDSDEFRAVIPDFSEDFQTYGVEWTPDKITWLVNDEVTGELTGDRVSQEQMYIILNLAVGGWFPGPPDENTQFPASFDIDYVRVYQRVQ